MLMESIWNGGLHERYNYLYFILHTLILYTVWFIPM